MGAIQIYNCVLMSEQNSEDLKGKVYSRQEYARANFWEDRYVENGGFFDWYAEFPQLKLAFKEYDIVKEDKILMVGCGNSKLSDQMYQNGYTNIVNIDISPTVIDQMKEKFPYMVWEVMDATKMTYPNGHFDVIIDKGTLDALISGKCYQICEAMLKQCMRVTKQAGQIILITYGSPQGRRKIFQNALAFDEYDYYQCRAELNDLSTMINLMRSNLPGQQLSSILKQQDAFMRTMKEFTIIKMMRRSRKNQKQYIVWNKYQKAQIQAQNNHIRQPSQEVKPQKCQTQQKEVAKQKQQFSYKPKKQPYVYVYSIKRKFTLGIQKESEREANRNEFGDISIQGSHDPSFTLALKEHLKPQALKGVNFAINNKQILKPAIFVTSSPERFLPDSVRIHIIQDTSSHYLCLRKTNLNLKITLTSKVKAQIILNDLPKLVRRIINKCSLHPSPRIYVLFSWLKDLKMLPSINELLQRYWYPSWRINSLTQQQLNLQFSIPPMPHQQEEKIIDLIKNSFKGYKINIGQVRKGFVSYVDSQLFNIISMACLSYTSQRANLLVEEFWEQSQDVKELHLIKESQYNEIGQTLLTKGGIVSKVVAHIIALY